MQKGKFITFEGGEGTGKSTQIKLLAAYLEKCGIKTMLSKDPGGTEIGLELRRILVTGDKDKIDAVTEALLYYADRRINLTQKSGRPWNGAFGPLTTVLRIQPLLISITDMTRKFRCRCFRNFIPWLSAALSLT